MMKKIFTVFILIALVLSMAACGAETIDPVIDPPTIEFGDTEVTIPDVIDTYPDERATEIEPVNTDEGTGPAENNGPTETKPADPEPSNPGNTNPTNPGNPSTPSNPTNPTQPHTHSYSKKVTSPTCTAKGYTTYSCSCGNSYKDDYTDALGHDYKTTTVAATCTAKGYTEKKCSRCGDSSKSNYKDALGHDMVNQGTSGDYQTDNIGYYATVTYKCSRCGYSTSEKQLIRKWSDFNVSYMQQAAVNYACSQYGCKYDPSMNLSNSSYYSGYTAFGYDENKIISKAYGQVDFTFNKLMSTYGWTVDDISGVARVNVYIEQDGSGWEIYVLYG